MTDQRVYRVDGLPMWWPMGVAYLSREQIKRLVQAWRSNLPLHRHPREWVLVLGEPEC